MASPVIQVKRGLLANLPGLRTGEPGFTTDSYDLYVGLTSETATNKIVGSARFWTNNTSTTGSGVNLVEGTSTGDSYITLKAPDSLAGIVTYTMPGTDGSAGHILTTNGSGVLSFVAPTSSSFIITGGTGSDTFFTGETLTFAGTANEIETTVTNNQVQIGLPDDVIITNNFKVSGISTTDTLVLNGTSGIAITAISSSTSLAENSNSYLPTQAAVKAYVDAVDVTTGIAGDTGTGTVSTSQTLTVAGTAGEIETSASSQTITIGLPNDVIVGTSLSAPTVKTATLQHRNGTQAATIDTSGNITASQNLTVSGNLYVNGSTTQVNTTSLTVEDRTIELGIVNGSAPSAATTWDLGVLFNYYQTSAKKSAVVWEQADSRFKFASEVSDGGGTDNDSPQITFTAYAPIEIGSLWVTDCAGTSQVISCTGTTRNLENITIDGGSF